MFLLNRLGKISRIRVWHDNSGSSPSWYLSRIVIKNLLNGQKYFFFCNRYVEISTDQRRSQNWKSEGIRGGIRDVAMKNVA